MPRPLKSTVAVLAVLASIALSGGTALATVGSATLNGGVGCCTTMH